MTARTRMNLAIVAALAAFVGAGVVAMKISTVMDPHYNRGTPFSVVPREPPPTGPARQ